MDTSEIEDESKDWMETVDRGELKHISNMTYMMLVSVELELHKYIMLQNQSAASAELYNTSPRRRKRSLRVIMYNFIGQLSHQTGRRIQPRPCLV